MKNWFQLLWLLAAFLSGTVLSFGTGSSAEIRFFGRIEFGVGTNRELSFKVTHDPRSGADHLVIELRSQEAQPQVLKRDPEIDQEFITNAYFYQLRNGISVVCVEWALGARSMGLTVYGADAKNQITKLFDDSCEYGFQFVNLDGGQMINLVAFDRLGKSGEFQARVFALNLSSMRFEEVRKEKTDKPHRYRLVTKTK